MVDASTGRVGLNQTADCQVPEKRGLLTLVLVIRGTSTLDIEFLTDLVKEFSEAARW